MSKRIKILIGVFVALCAINFVVVIPMTTEPEPTWVHKIWGDKLTSGQVAQDALDCQWQSMQPAADELSFKAGLGIDSDAWAYRKAACMKAKGYEAH